MNILALLLRNRAAIVVGAAYLLSDILFGTYFMSSHYGDAVFAYLLYSALGLVVVWQSSILYAGGSRETCCGMTSIRLFAKHVSTSLILALLIELGTLVGAYSATPFVLSDWSLQRIIIYATIVYSCILEALVFLPSTSTAPELLLGYVAGIRAAFLNFISNNRFRIPVVAVLSLAIALVLSRWLGLSIFAVLSFVSALAVSITYVITRRNAHGDHPERLFLSVALPVGMAFIFALPCNNLISWDDDVHYRNALELSYISDVETTASDRMLINNLSIEPGFSSTASLGRAIPIDSSVTWSQADIDRLNSEFDEQAVPRTTTVQPGISAIFLSIKALSYIPSAIGLWVGRLLHLPFFVIYGLGRFMNLLSYCIVCYLAIKVMPVKRTLLCVLALLPTALIMASTYSYDPTVLSFTYLGLAIFTRELLADREVRWTNVGLSLVLLFIAFSSKAIYFPIMGIVLVFIWNDRCSASLDRKLVICFAITLAFTLVVSFVLPLLFHAPGDIGDARGGEEVNSMEQLSFILSNPLQYARLIARYIFQEYLPVASIEDAFTNLSYLGSVNALVPYATGLVALCIVGVAVLDSDKDSIRLISWKNACWVLFISACILVLICTSLYVSFTAVGSDTVKGVQSRYLLPLLPTFFLFVFNFKTICLINRSRFTGVTVSVASAVLYACLWIFLIARTIA